MPERPKRSGSRPPARPPSPAVARRRRVLARVSLGLVVAIALLFVYVFPARTLLDQRRQEDKARDTFELLREQNARLERDSKRLLDDAELERIAREDYGMVFPNEEPYVAVTAPATTTTTTTTTTTSATSTTGTTGTTAPPPPSTLR